MLNTEQFVQTPKLTADQQVAWELYCKDTAGDMDVRDFWWELPLKVQEHYLQRI